MSNNEKKKFKPKYNLAIGYGTIGLFIFATFTLAKIKSDNEGRGGVTILLFFLISIFVVIPLVASFRKTCTFELSGNILTISYLFGVVNEVVDLQNIAKVTVKERLITYGKDIRLMMGIKKIKEIKIEFENQKTITIDGNTLQDEDFVLLKSSLLRLTRIRK